jgi:hypothetical protein
MYDEQGARITVTVFDMGSTTEPEKELGTVDLKGGGGAVLSKTTPAFKVSAHKASDWHTGTAPAPQTTR